MDESCKKVNVTVRGGFNLAMITSFQFIYLSTLYALDNENVTKLYLKKKKNKLLVNTNFLKFISQHLPKDVGGIPRENLTQKLSCNVPCAVLRKLLSILPNSLFTIYLMPSDLHR
jgi:hypothetical protein